MEGPVPLAEPAAPEGGDTKVPEGFCDSLKKVKCCKTPPSKTRSPNVYAGNIKNAEGVLQQTIKRGQELQNSSDLNAPPNAYASKGENAKILNVCKRAVFAPNKHGKVPLFRIWSLKCRGI